jgi:hypothetical protein
MTALDLIITRSGLPARTFTPTRSFRPTWKDGAPTIAEWRTIARCSPPRSFGSIEVERVIVGCAAFPVPGAWPMRSTTSDRQELLRIGLGFSSSIPAGGDVTCRQRFREPNYRILVTWGTVSNWRLPVRGIPSFRCGATPRVAATHLCVHLAAAISRRARSSLTAGRREEPIGQMLSGMKRQNMRDGGRPSR